MLKIKQKRMKDLEKFGFRYVINEEYGKPYYQTDNFLIWCYNRQIQIFGISVDLGQSELFYDLIKADMVEKVEE